MMSEESTVDGQMWSEGKFGEKEMNQKLDRQWV